MSVEHYTEEMVKELRLLKEWTNFSQRFLGGVPSIVSFGGYRVRLHQHYALGYALWFAMFHLDKTIFIATPTYRMAIAMMDSIREIYDTIPEFARADIYRNRSKFEIEFDNGSRIIARQNPDHGRGMGLSLILMSEHIQPDKIDAWMRIFNVSLVMMGRVSPPRFITFS